LITLLSDIAYAKVLAKMEGQFLFENRQLVGQGIFHQLLLYRLLFAQSRKVRIMANDDLPVFCDADIGLDDVNTTSVRMQEGLERVLRGFPGTTSMCPQMYLLVWDFQLVLLNGEHGRIGVFEKVV